MVLKMHIFMLYTKFLVQSSKHFWKYKINPWLKIAKEALENLLFTCEDNLTEMIAISEQAKLEKNWSVIMCSFHSTNFPLSAASAALRSASFCPWLCHLDPVFFPATFAQKQYPHEPSLTVISMGLGHRSAFSVGTCPCFLHRFCF